MIVFLAVSAVDDRAVDTGDGDSSRDLRGDEAKAEEGEVEEEDGKATATKEELHVEKTGQNKGHETAPHSTHQIDKEVEEGNCDRNETCDHHEHRPQSVPLPLKRHGHSLLH